MEIVKIIGLFATIFVFFVFFASIATMIFVGVKRRHDFYKEFVSRREEQDDIW